MVVGKVPSCRRLGWRQRRFVKGIHGHVSRLFRGTQKGSTSLAHGIFFNTDIWLHLINEGLRVTTTTTRSGGSPPSSMIPRNERSSCSYVHSQSLHFTSRVCIQSEGLYPALDIRALVSYEYHEERSMYFMSAISDRVDMCQ